MAGASSMTAGSFCTGYAGLDRAFSAVFPHSRLAWVSDIDPGPTKLLAQRYPGVPNLGDITATDWSKVEPVDVILAGYPCQGESFRRQTQRSGR